MGLEVGLEVELGVALEPVGLARLAFNADHSAISKMISEADVDGNVGIDQEEFVSVIMRITVEETGSISNSDNGRA